MMLREFRRAMVKLPGEPLRGAVEIGDRWVMVPESPEVPKKSVAAAPKLTCRPGKHGRSISTSMLHRHLQPFPYHTGTCSSIQAASKEVGLMRSSAVGHLTVQHCAQNL